MSFTTRESLLNKIQDGDQASWEEFYLLYRPMAFRHGRRLGLSREECDELFQQVMVQFFKSIGTFHYQPELGRFRNYLIRALRHAASRLLEHRQPVEMLPETLSAVNEGGLLNEIDRKILADWRGALFNQALAELKKQVEQQTFEAFCFYGLQRREVGEVADYLQMKPGSVYTAKSRCVAMLRNIIGELQKSDPEFKL